MSRPIQVANAQAFWGDYPQAPADMLRLAPDVNYLTLDYLAEVSMSILAKQRSRDPNLGFARDYITVVESLAPYWVKGSTVKIISNAGGLSPRNCALLCVEVLRQAGCSGRRIGVVTGDSVLSQLQQSPGDNLLFRNLDSGESLQRRRDELITANAYVGARPIVEALQAGADMVITGRIADPSLTVAPCVFEHGWTWQAYDQLAGATVAGHLIECGTQVTGGISTHWLDIADPDKIGYPIVEVDDQGNCVVTKPLGTGGQIDLRTVKEQLLYELGDPGNYLSPDVSVSFLSLELEDQGNDRVWVRGAKGAAPPPTLKVSCTHQAGFHTSGTLVIFGEDAVHKARRCGELVLKRLADHGLAPAETRIECLGAGAVAPLQELPNQNVAEVVLRVSIADSRREIIQQFADDWMSLVCCGPQGTTGYAGGRPRSPRNLRLLALLDKINGRSHPRGDYRSMKSMLLKEIAYARSGDKGCNANIGLIAYTADGYQRICQEVTEQRVIEFFGSTPVRRVVRYELPNLWALNFLLYGVLGKGGSQSLAIDAQGKTLGQALLTMEIEHEHGAK